MRACSPSMSPTRPWYTLSPSVNTATRPALAGASMTPMSTSVGFGHTPTAESGHLSGSKGGGSRQPVAASSGGRFSGILSWSETANLNGFRTRVAGDRVTRPLSKSSICKSCWGSPSPPPRRSSPPSGLTTGEPASNPPGRSPPPPHARRRPANSSSHRAARACDMPFTTGAPARPTQRPRPFALPPASHPSATGPETAAPATPRR